MGEMLHTVGDRASFEEATVLIAQYGEAAVLEAACKADAFHSAGDLMLACRWRQVERAIQLLQLEDIIGEIH